MKNGLIAFLIMLLSVKVFSQSSQLKSYLIDLGRFKVPISNEGVLGDVAVDTMQSGLYDGKTVLFSGGFGLSGYNGNSLWANGVLTASRIVDYLPGVVGGNSKDPKYSMYVIKASDPPFGEAWQKYRDAVSIGASYYDGSKDGKYDPKDSDGNGNWDLNEDCPDILGDITAWCVYNDAVPRAQRRFTDVNPQGIEIHQSVFGFYNTDIMFIRYRIINKGTITEKLDSIIFSTWTDFDIGDYWDDLSGCDTLRNLGFTYNGGWDNEYGNNSPSIGVVLLQGPPVYIAGETFHDINTDGVFEEFVDIPLDTAIQKNGIFLLPKILSGARNQKTTANTVLLGITYSIDYIVEFRNYQKGLGRNGEKIKICTWSFGVVYGGIDCNQVNPLFHYSGDPVNQIGWINTFATDQRMILSTGEFSLIKDKPIDIWVAYVVGRGTDSLDSVTKMKYKAMLARQFYNDLPLKVPEYEKPQYIPGDFRLYQNYPNPFNPITKIKYDIPKVGSRASLFVNMKVYDLLGNEVAELVNEEKSPGNYEVTFNADKLASGVYIYKLKTLGYLRFKKMILIK